MHPLPRMALWLAAAIALFGTAIHWIAPLLGPGWYAFLHAPAWVVASAQAGSWPAPVASLVIGGLMGLAGAYALSAAGSLKRLPLTRPAMWVLALLCCTRGLILLPLLLRYPQWHPSRFDWIAALVWLLAGIGFAFGCREEGRNRLR